ncbi:MAG: hypothetical protein FJY92_07680 [Candidatus Hydrogenedentes bacterium]|nr:hypothetical protein [Candidatus Hydrogenedentota bacterium]
MAAKMLTRFKVVHSCGHEVTHGYSGPEGGRETREAWLRERPCQVCWRNEQAAAASGQTQSWDLPPLEGSDANKSWAEVIRAKAIAHNRDYHRRLVANAGKVQQDDELRNAIVAAADAALREIELQSSAAWWIEHRFDALDYVRVRTAEAIAPIMEGKMQ